MFINDNILIMYFHFNFDAKYEQYQKHYIQTHDIVFIKLNLQRKINYAINKFLNICVNRFVFVEFVVIMTIIVFIFAFAIKNQIIIQMKYCTHCERYYHVKNECWNKHSHLKRDRQNRKNQSDQNDRDNKRKKKTTRTMTTIIATMTTRTSRNVTNCTSSCSSKRYQQWTSCSLKSSSEFLTMHAFNITFERNRRWSRIRRLTNSFRSMISKNQFTLWNKKRFAWFAKSTISEWTFHSSTFFTSRNVY